jgi:hypothetical protein
MIFLWFKVYTRTVFDPNSHGLVQRAKAKLVGFVRKQETMMEIL